MSIFQRAFQNVALPALLGAFQVQVTYTRGKQSITIGVLMDDSDVEEYDGTQDVVLRSREISFRIRASDLNFGAGEVTPKRGDSITLPSGTKLRILPGRNDSFWEWATPHQYEYLVTAIVKP